MSSNTTRAIAVAATGIISYLALQNLKAKKEAKAEKEAETKVEQEEEQAAPRPKVIDEAVRDPVFEGIKLDREEFLQLLGDIMKHNKYLQNMPPKHIPQEDLVADIVVKFLEPYSQPNGPLIVRKVTYVKGRSNIIIKYPAATETEKVCSFVGSHMDVVTANPDDWVNDPFELKVEGDKLYGRGVTDCLGHIATLTILFKQLALLQPKLAMNVVGVFIANEEASETLGIGVDELEKQGELKDLRHGPLFWVDSANLDPTIGSGGVVTWELLITGKKFHSGFPHIGINPIELGGVVVKHIQKRFHEDFPQTPMGKKYGYAIGSSMKPTQISSPPGSINQIPQICSIKGDIRFTPFYQFEDIKAKVEQYVAELDVSTLETQGFGKYELPEEGLKGMVTLNWLGKCLRGVAVDLNSFGFHAICEALEHVKGNCKPFSLTGSLPIIADLKDAGYDVQITGFGRMDAYHAANEYGVISDFDIGLQTCGRILATLSATL